MAPALLLLLLVGFVVVKRGVRLPAFVGLADARRLVATVDSAEYGGWFSQGGRSHALVLAIIRAESNFDANAVGDLHLSDKSWGLMQVRGTTAKDRGFLDAEGLLDPYTGIRAGMAQLRWSWMYLQSQLGRAPTLSEWVSSYNAGVGNVVRNGIVNPGYVDKVLGYA